MQGQRDNHDSEEEEDIDATSTHSETSNIVMSARSASATLPAMPPPFMVYAGPGGIQGTFCAMPFPPVPLTSGSSSLPLMSLPPQMLYTAAAGNPYGSPGFPLLGAGSFLYPQFSSQAAYLSALQAKGLTSPPGDARGVQQDASDSDKREEGERESDSMSVDGTMPVAQNSTSRQILVTNESKQLLVTNEKQVFLHNVMQNKGPHHGRAQSVTTLTQATKTPIPETASAVLMMPSGENRRSSSEQSSTSLPSGSASVISRLLVQKSKQVPGTSLKPKTLEKLLTGSSNLEEDSLCPEVQDEPHFVNFCRFFVSSKKSSTLRMRLLKTEGNGVLKWLEVSQKASYIDPTVGPVDVARILLSSNGLCKLQLLFPYCTTVFTKFMPINQEEADKLLSELSTSHVLCPGLPDYQDKHAVLGYHPTHVRVLETPSVKRYDHEKCPTWHIPSNLFSKSGHLLHNMCKYCRSLQGNLVRQATKACEIDPRERESWTDPSSHRPLAFMSPADKEERYRKLRQERTQLVAKLRAYEEQLGIVSNRRNSLSEPQGDQSKPASVQQLLEKYEQDTSPQPEKHRSSVDLEDASSTSEASSTTSTAPTLKELIQGGRGHVKGQGRGQSAEPTLVSSSSRRQTRATKRKASLTPSTDASCPMEPPAGEEGPRDKMRRTDK